MPFGLKNAPSVFQRLMNCMLADMARFSAAYIDDIVVFSKTFEKYIVHLEAVFSRLEETGLVLKPTKCKLAEPTCQYLGHRVGAGEVHPLQAKIDDLTSNPKPLKKKDMRSFLGLAIYYRRFIPGFGSIAVPLTESTQKQAPNRIEWTSVRLAAFQQLRTSLTEDSVLVSPDEEKLFLLHTDASGIGIGAVLSQLGEDEMDRPVAYYSRKLKPAETRYIVTEQECLAVVEAVRHFRVYLSGTFFTIVTDHSSLRYLTQMKDENGRLARSLMWFIGQDRRMQMLMECLDNPGHRTSPTSRQLSKEKGGMSQGCFDSTELRLTVIICIHTRYVN